MAGNEFDPSVMPSAAAARREERRMTITAPIYALIAILVAACILLAVYLGTTMR